MSGGRPTVYKPENADGVGELGGSWRSSAKSLINAWSPLTASRAALARQPHWSAPAK
jgi:hypothetical protein